MSLDASAIEKLINIGQERNKIDVGAIPAAVIDKNSSIASFEHLLDKPVHHRAKFTTTVFGDFMLYCLANCSHEKNSTIYIDQKAMCARAIFDHGDDANPEWGHHNANLILDKTPEFAALIASNNQDMSQQDFVDFLTDWQTSIVLADAEDAPLGFQDAINRIRKLNVTSLSKAESEVGNFSASKSALESVEVSAGATKPPAILHWLGLPYEGFGSRKFSAEIRAVVKGNDIRLRYRIIQLENATNQIAQEFRRALQEKLEENAINIYLGSIQHR